MEFRVYDGASRRVGPILIVGLAKGMLAAFSTLFLTAQGATRIRNGLFLVLLLPAAIILALSAVISLMMSVQIRIERMTGKFYGNMQCSASTCRDSDFACLISTVSASTATFALVTASPWSGAKRT
jgi:hypothetical protein